MKYFPTRPLVYQSGSALMIILALILLAFTASLATYLPNVNRDAKTANANAAVLAQAKAALIAYAVSAGRKDNNPCSGTNCERPGDLPCPDMTADDVNWGQEGVPAPPPQIRCGNSGATGQTNRLGRLPWKTLDLPPDLRDASGNRLWYAVSTNFKGQSRSAPLNSDTFGTITIRNPNGNVVNNGSNPSNIPSGVIAVIIAPGDAIKRQDGHQQNRANNAANEYLDIATLNGITEDNANFVDGSATNGFIQGPIKDASGKIISNDQMVFITYEDLMPLIERRIAGEVLRAVADMQYPNPASFNDTTCLGSWGSLDNFSCPLNSPWCNNPLNAATPVRTLLIDCSKASTLRHPLCATDSLFVSNKTQIEVTCPAGGTPTSALAFRCSPKVTPDPPTPPPSQPFNCGTNLTATIAASACTYTGPRVFEAEVCSGRTTLWAQPNQANPYQPNPNNCGRVPPSLGVQSWGPSDILRGSTGGLDTWFQLNGWRELVFYATQGTCNGASTPLKITDSRLTPSTTFPGHAIVMVAGRRLSSLNPGQVRANPPAADKTTRSNYFENGNGNSMSYSAGARSTSFNDTVIGQ